MSAIYDMYKKIDGDEAFLSGVVSTFKVYEEAIKSLSDE